LTNAGGLSAPLDRLSDKGIRLLRPSLFSTLKSRDGLFLELAEKLLADVASGAVKQGVHKVRQGMLQKKLCCH
jgi:hypothetical protein